MYKFERDMLANLPLVRTDLTRVFSPSNSTTDGSRLTFFVTFSYISFSSFTFPGTAYRILLPFLPWLPCHFYLVIIEQQQAYCLRFRCYVIYLKLKTRIECDVYVIIFVAQFSLIRINKLQHL